MKIESRSHIIYLIISIVFLEKTILDLGYIFAPDMAPYRYVTGIIYGIDIFYPTSSQLPYILIELMNKIIPAQTIPKIFLFFGIFLSGVSLYYLLPLDMRLSKCFASFIYTVNPFIYARFLIGHWKILFAYALIPFAIKLLVDLLEKKKKKEIIKFVLILSILAFSIHILIISLIIMTIIFLFWFNKYRDIKIIKLFAISGILFLLLNSYWIVPLLTAKNTIIDNITDKDYEVFAPKGSLFDIAAMYGFWREGYIYAKDFIPYWQLLSIFIISLAIYGFISYYRDEKIGYLVKALGVIGIIGFILATGINGPFGDFNHWLYDNTILKGFRDSQKFVAMIVLAYAVLGGLGVNKIKSVCDNIDKKNIRKINK